MMMLKKNNFPETKEEGPLGVPIGKMQSLVMRESVEEAFALLDRWLSQGKGQQTQQERVMREAMEKVNESAMVLLKKGRQEVCLEVLRRCEIVTQPCEWGFFPELRALIFNNLGCYYKRVDNP